MELDICNFFPKYPNFKNNYLNSYENHNNFNNYILNKKEFNELKLDKIEEFPKEKGELMKHQKFISRFLSSNTQYNSLLLYHEMGTGKTCSAIGAIEKIKNENNSGKKGALILASGDALIKNFKNEIIFKCTDGRYIPEDDENLTKIKKIRRENKILSNFYSFNTFQTFAKEIKKTNDSALINRYSNLIIVFDEIHNIRLSDKKSNIDTYKQFHRFLHLVKNCKILLMSGTPMKDTPEEIAAILNLILDMDNQFPIEDNFKKEYLIQNNNNTNLIKMKPNKIKEFKNKCRGIISYLSSMKSDIKKIFIGEKNIGNLKYFIINPNIMSKFQEKYYIDAYFKDISGQKQGVYKNSRQASLFIYPDGSYGSKGFEKYLRKKIVKTILTTTGKRKQISKFVLKNELLDEFKGNTEEKLEKLKKFSCKYYEVIKNILNAYEKGEKCFVYGELVQGSGIILFSKLLEIFGFTHANNSTKKEGKRYFLATRKTKTHNEIKNVINNIFNKEDNYNGKIINVVIGSYVIAEGITLKDIIHEHILTPYWNYSETSQVIARGWRLGSHNNLLKRNIKPNVNIYKYVSLPTNINNSIDLQMYKLSEIKDFNIKYIERFIKEASIDCELFYNRNRMSDKIYNNTRDCEYMNCDYKCDNETNKIIDDFSTYNIYYNKEDNNKIIKTIKDIFKKQFYISLSDLYKILNYIQPFIILNTVRNIVNKNLPITNNYGFTCYLREENNVLFLINDITVVNNNLENLYYIKNPIIKLDRNYSDILKIIEERHIIPNLVTKCCNSKDFENLKKNILKLPLEIQLLFLQNSLLVKKLNINQNIILRDNIIEIYKRNTFYIDDEIIILLNNFKKCLQTDNIWKDCSQLSIDKLKDIKSNIDDKIKSNSYGFYGIYNRENDKFCIGKISNNDEKDKRKKNTGKVCENFFSQKKDFIKILIENIPLPIPENSNDNKIVKVIKKINSSDIQTIINLIQKSKYIDNSDIINNHINNKNIEELKRIYFWSAISSSKICPFLKLWFEKNNLLLLDKNCGTSFKKK